MSPLFVIWLRSTQRLGPACRRATAVFVTGLAWQVVWKRPVWYWDEQLWSQTIFFLITTCILCKMQLGIWCLFLWNTVILWLMTKGRWMFFDESVATIFVFWPILKTSGQHRSQPDDTQISCCILHSEALSILLSGFQALKMILSVEVFEERNRCLTVYTERPWQGMSSRFVLLSGVKLIPKYVILTPLLSWYKKA